MGSGHVHEPHEETLFDRREHGGNSLASRVPDSLFQQNRKGSGTIPLDVILASSLSGTGRGSNAE